jgi:hypothetical protein
MEYQKKNCYVINYAKYVTQFYTRKYYNMQT